MNNQKVVNADGSVITMSIRNKMIIVCFLLVLGPLLTLGFISNLFVQKELASLTNGGDLNTSSQLFLITIITSLIALAVTTVFIIIFSRKITNPIISISNQLEEIAEGNLTIEPEVKDNDEVGMLASSSKKMVHSLRSVISQLSYTSSHLAASADQLNSSTEQSTVSTQQVVSSTESVVRGSEAQLDAIQNGTEVLKEVNNTIMKILTNVQNAAALVQQTLTLASDGSNEIEKSTDQMKVIEGKISNLDRLVNNLGGALE